MEGTNESLSRHLVIHKNVLATIKHWKNKRKKISILISYKPTVKWFEVKQKPKQQHANDTKKQQNRVAIHAIEKMIFSTRNY